MTTWLEAPLLNWSKSSREANTLPQCKSSCEEQAGSDKNWSVKPYSLMSCCWRDAICKANQSTYGPFKSRSRLKLGHMSGPLELKANSCTRTTSCKYKIRDVTAQIWPWGLTYIQRWSNMQIFEGYAEFESFCLHCAGLWICHRGNLAS